MDIGWESEVITREVCRVRTTLGPIEHSMDLCSHAETLEAALITSRIRYIFDLKEQGAQVRWIRPNVELAVEQWENSDRDEGDDDEEDEEE